MGGVFSGPHIGHQNVDLKYIISYFSSKNWIILCQQRIVIQVHSHGELSANLFQKCRGELLYKAGKEVGALQQTESMAFHWLNYDHHLLVEPLLGNKRESLFFLLDSAITVEHNSLFWPPDCIFFFYKFYSDIIGAQHCTSLKCNNGLAYILHGMLITKCLLNIHHLI